MRSAVAGLVFVAIAGFLPLVGTSDAQPPLKAEVRAGSRIAVLVGVNEYQNRPFQNLKYAEADVTELKGKLEAAGFKVVLLLGSAMAELPTDDELKKDPNRLFAGPFEASRANIAAVLLDRREENRRFALRDVASDADQVLVAFSGHGEQIPVLEEDETDRARKVLREAPHFCPRRAESGRPSTMVSLNDVLRTFNGGKAKSLLLVDACRVFAGNADGAKGAVIDRKRVDSLRPNVGGMFAAGDRQIARENDSLKHGLFIHAVLRAFGEEKCRDKDGNVVWSRMTDEIADGVREKSRELYRELKDDEHQKPQPFGAFTDKFVLARVAVRPEADQRPYPKVYALLIADAANAAVGQSCAKDIELVKKTLETHIDKDHLTINVLQSGKSDDSPLSRNRILEAIRKVGNLEGHTLVCYFSGIGGVDTINDKSPFMVLRGGPGAKSEKEQEILYRSELLAWMRATNAQLRVLLTDASHNFYDKLGKVDVPTVSHDLLIGHGEKVPHAPKTGKKPLTGLETLLWTYEGEIEIAASLPGQQSFISPERGCGYLAYALAEKLAPEGITTWTDGEKLLVKAIQSESARELAKLDRRFLRDQTDQTPVVKLTGVRATPK